MKLLLDIEIIILLYVVTRIKGFQPIFLLTGCCHHTRQPLFANGGDGPKIEIVHSSPGDDDEDENVEPGQMKVSEIKSELELRGIDYSDCFDNESLSERLIEARALGKANPNIIDKFNKARLEDTFNEKALEIKNEDLENMTANDGTLPGGMNPGTFQKMIGNPELMALLQNTKIQDAMKLMMSGGPKELEAAIENDPEIKESLHKLQEVMGKMGLDFQK